MRELYFSLDKLQPFIHWQTVTFTVHLLINWQLRCILFLCLNHTLTTHTQILYSYNRGYEWIHCTLTNWSAVDSRHLLVSTQLVWTLDRGDTNEYQLTGTIHDRRRKKTNKYRAVETRHKRGLLIDCWNLFTDHWNIQRNLWDVFGVFPFPLLEKLLDQISHPYNVFKNVLNALRHHQNLFEDCLKHRKLPKKPHVCFSTLESPKNPFATYYKQHFPSP